MHFDQLNEMFNYSLCLCLHETVHKSQEKQYQKGNSARCESRKVNISLVHVHVTILGAP